MALSRKFGYGMTCTLSPLRAFHPKSVSSWIRGCRPPFLPHPEAEQHSKESQKKSSPVIARIVRGERQIAKNGLSKGQPEKKAKREEAGEPRGSRRRGISRRKGELEGEGEVRGRGCAFPIARKGRSVEKKRERTMCSEDQAVGWALAVNGVGREIDGGRIEEEEEYGKEIREKKIRGREQR